MSSRFGWSCTGETAVVVVCFLAVFPIVPVCCARSDIMLAMGGGLGKSADEYMSMASSDPDSKLMAAARAVLWSTMNTTPFYTIVVNRF
jgi:hypothetical protein